MARLHLVRHPGPASGSSFRRFLRRRDHFHEEGIPLHLSPDFGFRVSGFGIRVSDFGLQLHETRGLIRWGGSRSGKDRGQVCGTPPSGAPSRTCSGFEISCFGSELSVQGLGAWGFRAWDSYFISLVEFGVQRTLRERREVRERNPHSTLTSSVF